jgi:hypothetical protein
MIFQNSFQNDWGPQMTTADLPLGTSRSDAWRNLPGLPMPRDLARLPGPGLRPRVLRLRTVYLVTSDLPADAASLRERAACLESGRCPTLTGRHGILG